jgi:glutaredoxin 3
MNITVYTTPGCQWCKAAKEYLKLNDISFAEQDVSKDKNVAMEMIKKSGQRAVPVIDIDGNIVVGFDQESIDKILGL